MAGGAAALAWAVAERPLRRLCRTPYSDIRLLGRLVTDGRGWVAAGLLLHLGNGAAAGVALDRLGVRGPLAGIAAAEAEVALLWPGMAIVDRLHPDHRGDRHGHVAGDPATIVEQLLVHAIFGAVLGLLLRERRRRAV
jgi:hypothetical protein